MHRILIIDDEIYAADSLRDYIAAHFDDRYDVYSEYTAAAALTRIKRGHFDIVVTDIKMPGMDGIELSRLIRRNRPACRIIFMSGYDNFDYIYNAMRGGGTAYILKSELYTLIGGELEKAARAIDGEFEAALEQGIELYPYSMVEKPAAYRLRDISFRQGTEGDRWSTLINRLAVSTGAGEAEARELCALNFPIRDEGFGIALFQIDADGAPMADKAALIRIGNGIERLAARILISCALYATIIKPHLVMLLMQPDAAAGENAQTLSASVERLQTAVRDHMGVDADVFVADGVASFSELRAAVDRAKHALYGLEPGAGRFMVMPDDYEASGSAADNQLNYMRYLQRATGPHDALKREDPRAICEFIEGFEQCFETPAGMSFTPMIEIYMSIAAMLLAFIAGHGLYDRAMREMPVFKLFKRDEFKNWAEACGKNILKNSKILKKLKKALILS